MPTPFHFAFNVQDIKAARHFYGGILSCPEGRSTDTWIDYNFFGHQLSLHLGEPFKTQATGKVGSHLVPMPHLGVVLPMADWTVLAERLQDHDISFVIPPSLRFEGDPGEQATMFFRDPSGNPIEVKGFKDMALVFAA
ncbi:dioxygenase [Phaeobacter gallaeciensis]|uniref:Dioxygenase n=1 Tax=Phaeobacter gallaeciensis TaxID=60890 RepID=A0A366WUA9_9RHOB|nr:MULTISPECIES: VOC family protein [Roseobacteraceae]MBT8169520.1 VOC family protein [Falsiruegeria litorea]RBW53565.1 dioxygenase [Phaeobacter gallaeciensis]